MGCNTAYGRVDFEEWSVYKIQLNGTEWTVSLSANWYQRPPKIIIIIILHCTLHAGEDSHLVQKNLLPVSPVLPLDCKFWRSQSNSGSWFGTFGCCCRVENTCRFLQMGPNKMSLFWVRSKVKKRGQLIKAIINFLLYFKTLFYFTSNFWTIECIISIS